MKKIILLTLMTATVLLGQKLKLGDTESMIEFTNTPKKIFLEIQNGETKEIIWYRYTTDLLDGKIVRL